jgi:hypothetical protein
MVLSSKDKHECKGKPTSILERLFFEILTVLSPWSYCSDYHDEIILKRRESLGQGNTDL